MFQNNSTLDKLLKGSWYLLRSPSLEDIGKLPGWVVVVGEVVVVVVVVVEVVQVVLVVVVVVDVVVVKVVGHSALLNNI